MWQFKLYIHPSSQPLATTILLSVSVNLTILSTSYMWNHTVFVLLWLVYFFYVISSRFIHVVACVNILFKTE